MSDSTAIVTQEAIPGGPLVLLGSSAKCSSEKLKVARRALTAIEIRYVMQAAARELWLKVWGYEMQLHTQAKQVGPAPKAHRVANCLRVPHARHVDVLHVPAKQAGVFRGLQTCGSVWACAVCAAKISERRRVEVASAFVAARSRGYKVLMVTYTIRHSSNEELSQLVGGLLKARAGLVSGQAASEFRQRFGFLGSIRSLEVTHGGNGWHPHMHEAMIVRADVDPEQVRAELLPRWSSQVERAGLRGVNAHALDVTDSDEAIAEYLAKYDKLPDLDKPHEDPRRWGDSRELTKQVSKSGRSGSSSPADLLWSFVQGDEQAGMLWLEYASVFKGQRQVVWSPKLRQVLGLGVEQTDEELAAEVEEDAVLLARLSLSEWRLVLAADLRAEILIAAATGDPGAVWSVLAPLQIQESRALLREGVPF